MNSIKSVGIRTYEGVAMLEAKVLWLAKSYPSQLKQWAEEHRINGAHKAVVFFLLASLQHYTTLYSFSKSV